MMSSTLVLKEQTGTTLQKRGCDQTTRSTDVAKTGNCRLGETTAGFLQMSWSSRFVCDKSRRVEAEEHEEELKRLTSLASSALMCFSLMRTRFRCFLPSSN